MCICKPFSHTILDEAQTLNLSNVRQVLYTHLQGMTHVSTEKSRSQHTLVTIHVTCLDMKATIDQQFLT